MCYFEFLVLHQLQIRNSCNAVICVFMMLVISCSKEAAVIIKCHYLIQAMTTCGKNLNLTVKVKRRETTELLWCACVS
jgi:hypothetical protein